MDSHYLLLFILLLPLFFLFLKSKVVSARSNCKLPPGPWTMPIIGSLHHLVSFGLPHHAFHNLSQWYGGLIFLQLGEHPTIVVTSSEAAREIMKINELTFSSRPNDMSAKILSYGGKNIVYAPYGEHWRKVRKICILELLSSKRVQSFRSIREYEVATFIRQIASSSSSGQIVNLSEGLMAVTNNVVLRAIMGSKFKDQKSVLDDTLKAFEVATSMNLASLFPSFRIMGKISGAVRMAEECHKSFDQLLNTLIREHKENGVNGESEDLLAVLLRLHDEASENSLLTIDTIKAVIFDLIMGGTDTTTTTLDWVMAELIENPAVMKKAQPEVRQQLRGHDNITELNISELNFIFMRLVIKETLRLHPAVALIPRQCRKACNIFGYDIPEGTQVLVNAWAIGRNSECWKDAEDFRPERFVESDAGMHFNGMDFDLIPFGSGCRICPGMSFAVATIELVLASLLYHFDWELPCGMSPDQVDMTETFGSTARRKFPLLVYPQLYHDARKSG